MGFLRGILPLLALQGRSSAFLALPDPSKLYITEAKPCPVSCEKSPEVADWTVYHETTRLAVCDQPMLLDFHLYNPINDPSTSISIRACTVGNADTKVNYLQAINYRAPDAEDSNEPVEDLPLPSATPSGVLRRQSNSTTPDSCGGKVEKSSASAKLSWWSADEYVDELLAGDAKNALIAVQNVQSYLKDPVNCKEKIVFSYVRGTLVGVYTGHGVAKASTADGLVQQFADALEADGIQARTAIEVCKDDMTAFDITGIVADIHGDLAAVQEIIRGWNEAKCTSGSAGSKDWKNVLLYSARPAAPPIAERSTFFSRMLSARADCRSIRVVSGDTCSGTLPGRCGIGSTAFANFNKDACAKPLSEGQAVCCSSGTLPDIRPKPGSDGVCATWTVEKDQYCAMIASTNGISQDDLLEFNKKTWGWTGCGPNLQSGIKICVSKGDPPMPASVSNAVCGPTVPDTPFPGSGKNLSELNPCPLKTCCNIWGQCGTTTDFCVISKSETGNPGTSEKGKNGCIANCGMEIVNNGQGPATFRKIGYFEGWNLDRECLQMHVGRIDDTYTHIHFSFAEISNDFNVVIPEKVKGQFDEFKKATKYKKILAFGGWSFSTEFDTSPIFGQSVTAANRAAFADRVIQFAKDNNLDGLDFDWEYPSVTDIPGVVGHKDDGKNYLEFLKLVKQKMPGGMSLSIAAPASFWYLKGFPIEDMAKTLDYIVYMTYDLHGQWDAGSLWANPGCPSGSCLRSHVNYTETYNALSMITKAGVPSHKVVVGVSSYGRSFKMSDSSCRGPECTFLGDRSNSPAKPGRCTGTGGYLANAEIDEIINGGGAVKLWGDDDDTNFVVYEGTEWVAYMTDTTKNRRTAKYKEWNFGGTSDWAIDLQRLIVRGDEATGFEDQIDPGSESWEAPECTGSFETLDDLSKANVNAYCGPRYIIPILRRMLQKAIDDFSSFASKDYDKYFGLYAGYVADSAQEVTTNFLKEKGKDYFNCQVVEKITCCRACYYLHGDNSKACQHCSLPYCNEIAGTSGELAKWENRTEACPPDLSERGLAPDNGVWAQSIFWTLRSDKEKSFWDDITGAVGAPREKIILGQRGAPAKAKTVDRGCTLNGMWSSPSCHREGYWFGAPYVQGFASRDVVNPKTVISTALEKVKGIAGDLGSLETEIIAHSFNGIPEDVVDAVALPVFLIQESVYSMNQVIEIGKKVEEANKKQFVMANTLLSVSMVFFLVPMVGQGIAALGLGTLARVLVTLGEVGALAQGIADIAENPESAPFAVLGLLLSAAGIRDATKIGAAAKIRRDVLTSEALGKLSPRIRTNIEIIGKVNNRDSWQPKVCVRK
ncbi:killer toxin subunits alpha/beta [Plectosphaerella plurivora]|uniref:chitinase n=1 Tax=Plectosphaerella plurivora TaxID=936078 RepID=A0A9P9A954_9PEZI|nr:killer toxin subunits alpha/beta [Plectosphaerella plurivora]